MQTAAPPGSICVATGCETAEEFIASFNRYCDKSSFFVATNTTRPVGSEVVFQVQLRDGERMLRGLGPVLAVWTDNDSPYGRPGVRIGIKKLTPASVEMFSKLRAARAANADPTLTGISIAPKAPAEPAASADQAAAPAPAPPPEPAPTPSVTTTMELALLTTSAIENVEAAPIAEKPAEKSRPSLVAAKPAKVTKPSPKLTATATAKLPPISGTITAGTIHPPKVPLPAIPLPGTVTPAVSRAPTPAPMPAPVVVSVPVAVPDPAPVAIADGQSNAVPIAIPTTHTMRLPSLIVPPAMVPGGTNAPAPRTPVARTRTSTQQLPVPVARTNTQPIRRMSTIAPWTPPATGPHPLTTPELAYRKDHEPGEPLPPPPRVTRTRPISRSLTEPLVGERTPGSKYVLPANPLTDFTDDAIGSFVEAATMVTERADDLSKPVSTTVTSTTVTVTTVASTTMAPKTATATSDGVVVETNQASPSEAHANFATPTTATPITGLSQRQIRRRPRWMVAAAAIGVIILGGLTLSPDGTMASASSPRKQQAIAAAPLPIPVPVMVVTEQEPKATVKPALEKRAGAARAECSLEVKSAPDGATVRVDGRVVGKTPVSTMTTCRRHRVVVSRAKYEADSRLVKVTKKEPAVLLVDLKRATHQMIVSTQPGGATVYLDGRPMGVTPTTVKVPAFTPVTVKLIKPGYAPLTRKVTSKKARHKLSARLLTQ